MPKDIYSLSIDSRNSSKYAGSRLVVLFICWLYRFQVAPAELEDLLLSHPHIRDAAVVGVADDAAGELPKAYIVRANNELTEQIVFDYVKGRL
jgi:hypothetical protein